MSRSIFLISDFGLSDTYVGQMKAALLRAAPAGSRLVDLTHDVDPGNVLQGAFHLRAASPAIPAGSVVLAVIDPGVGTDRRGVAVLYRGVIFVGPDNGIFSLLDADKAWVLPPPPPGSSSTFHGRDLFAPCAGRLAMDPGWTSFLEPAEPRSLVRLEIGPPIETEVGLEVTVVHTDRFGNVILWMDPEQFRDLAPSQVVLPSGEVRSCTRADTYGTLPGLLYLEGSQGCMELALGGGSAACELGLSQGDRVVLRGGSR